MSKSISVTFVALLLIAIGATPAFAERPELIRIHEPGMPEPIEITRGSDLDILILGLCTEEDAGSTLNRRFTDVEIVWSEDLVWTGEFYPASSTGPPATHILDWNLRVEGEGEPTLCDERLPDPDALLVLERYGVTTDLTQPATDDGGFPLWALWASLGGLIAIGALFVIRAVLRP